MDRLSASRRVPGSTLNQPIIIALHYFFYSFFSNLLSSSAYLCEMGCFFISFLLRGTSLVGLRCNKLAWRHRV